MSDHNEAVARQEISRVSDLLAALVEVQRAILGEMLTRRRSREWDENNEGADKRYAESCAAADVRTAAVLGEEAKP